MSDKAPTLRTAAGGVARNRTGGTTARLIPLAVALQLITACGGGAGSGGGGLTFRAVWEQPPAQQQGVPTGCTTPQPTPLPSGFGTKFPLSVTLVQIVVDGNGGGCCIRLVANEERRSVTLLDVPAGPAEVTITGFPNDDYAAPIALPDCRLQENEQNPVSLSCNGGGLDDPNPSFQSNPTQVNVLSAGSTNAGDIPVYARPFVLLQHCTDQQPVPRPPVGGVTTTTSVDFFVVDARGDVSEGTIEATVQQAGSSRPVGLNFAPCSDSGDDLPFCSCDGALNVTGFRSQSSAELQPAGAQMIISAAACDGQSMDFEYPFTYLPVPSTATATASPSDTPTRSATPTASETPTSSVTPTPSETPTSSVTATPSETPTSSVTATPSETPTVTPTMPVVVRIGDVNLAVGEAGAVTVGIDVPPGVTVAQIMQEIGFDLIAPITGPCEANGTPIPSDPSDESIFITLDAPIPASFTCNVNASVEAEPGASYPLACAGTIVTDGQGGEVSAACTPGQIVLNTPLPTVTPTMPVVVRIGDAVVAVGGTTGLTISVEIPPGVTVQQIVQDIGFDPVASVSGNCMAGGTPIPSQLTPDGEILHITLDRPIPPSFTCDARATPAAMAGQNYDLLCVSTSVKYGQETPVPGECTPGHIMVVP